MVNEKETGVLTRQKKGTSGARLSTEASGKNKKSLKKRTGKSDCEKGTLGKRRKRCRLRPLTAVVAKTRRGFKPL